MRRALPYEERAGPVRSAERLDLSPVLRGAPATCWKVADVEKGPGSNSRQLDAKRSRAHLFRHSRAAGGNPEDVDAV